MTEESLPIDRRRRKGTRTDPSVVKGPITPRQRDVMALTAEGLPFKEIGAVLGMGPKTVRTHQQNVLRRLDARNLAHAVAILLRRGEIL